MPLIRGVWHAVAAMFISAKRHEQEIQALIGASNRLTDAILKTSSAGLFLMDCKGQLQPQVSASLGTLFRRQDFTNLTVEKLIAPLVSAKTLSVVRTQMAQLLDLGRGEATDSEALQDVEVKLVNADGSFLTAHYCFEFSAVEISNEPRSWVVRVTDITARVQQQRELEDLRAQTLTQGEILRSVLQAGATRFGAFLQRTDASMKTINGVLKKTAREAGAFRNKLEETLEEVDRIRRDAKALKLLGLQSAARDFEDALQDLRSRASLSGSDFLPLAVKLDALYGQFAMLRSLTSQASPVREAEPAPPPAPDAHAAPYVPDAPDVPEARVTENGTQIIEAPKFFAEMSRAAAQSAQPAGQPAHSAQIAQSVQRMAAVGSLEGTLTTLADLVAQENHRSVSFSCGGLDLVPMRYQATVKNVAIQLIRNAVVHGIETAEERAAAGKPVDAKLNLQFSVVAGSGFELTFQDDGRGLDPDQVRGVAIAKGIVTEEEAGRLRDRQAIKLIFKSGYTTMSNDDGDVKHGSGMSLVRRYVHEAGGKIALASAVGKETRFKITLPMLEMSASAQVA